MPTYYHGGPSAVDPTKHFPEHLDGEDAEWIKSEKDRITEELRRHHPLTSPHRDHIKAGKLRRPAAYCNRNPQTGEVVETWDNWIPGSIVLALPGVGYHIIPPGTSVNLDPVSCPEKIVKAAAPHLLTEEEYQALVAKKKHEHEQSETKAPAPIADKAKAKA